MPHLPIIKWLQALALQPNSEELCIAAGDCPTIRLSNNVIRLETKSLTAWDTAELMQSITPECNQLELETSGLTEFDFALSGDSRYHVSVFGQQGDFRINVQQIRRQN